METTKLKRFAQYARRTLLEQVAAKMDMVLANDSAARRENAKAVQELKKQINETSNEHVIEKVAYIWFNRFCALRFMDVNSYSRISVVSPVEGQFQPEILSEAKMGHIDEEMVPTAIRQQIIALLNGSATSRDPQQEAYRLLVVAACNNFHRVMPYLFERIADYTELLMPDDLLSGNSILTYTREAMTPDTCKDVEVIGWLYQFYISEKKDDVFNGLKKSGKIAPEDIPAATQLFTPHYIVRYLVENSLGRLWMLNHPKSRLGEQMDYYIVPEQTETDFVRISKPEDIKVCDPACGSGHMLTYAYDLLYAIYEEEGYEAAEIPEKILSHNLYGIEIDERAKELAAFALTMKAAKGNPNDDNRNHRRFFRNPVQPNICALQNILFEKDELDEYIDAFKCDLFTLSVRETLTQFGEAENFGSLILPVAKDVTALYRVLEKNGIGNQLLLEQTHKKTLKALQQADYLSSKYHVVIANPPYMDKYDDRLRSFAGKNYPNSKANTYSMFIERCLNLSVDNGSAALITLQGWMFNSSYEKLRSLFLKNYSISSMIHLGTRAFDSIGGEVVSTTAFSINKTKGLERYGVYIDLTKEKNELGKSSVLSRIISGKNNNEKYLKSFSEFQKVPGAPIAYWASYQLLDAFTKFKALGDSTDPRSGMATGDNNRFLRVWSEVALDKIGFGLKSRDDAKISGKFWFPYNKGGSVRKWYGNNDYVVLFHNDGYLIKKTKEEKLAAGHITANNSKCWNQECYFLPCLTWSALSTSISIRYCGYGFIFDTKGQSLFANKTEDLQFYGALLNSKVSSTFLELLTPTLDFNSGYLRKIPDCITLFEDKSIICGIERRCRNLAEADWNQYETSWDFSYLPLLHPDYRQATLTATYQTLRSHWREMTQEMWQLEEKSNQIFIKAYSLEGELEASATPPLSEITLTCNPQFRYGIDKGEEELEELLLADTLRELISYAVGCMFGRYSLDKPGLILATQRENLEDFLRQVPEPSFMPDEDNVIPLLDGDWFTDDISERFRNFLRGAFGLESYEDNLRFIEAGLGKKGKPLALRDYFLKEFYIDHIKRYKKRPIYWLFTSPKGTFNALIYMHRYRPDTVGVVLNDYLREFRTKLAARKSHLEQVSISGSASASEKTKALKEIEILKKNVVELEGYERDVLYPLATQRLEIDLDDGVKANYGKFGAALKKIVGLDATED